MKQWLKTVITATMLLSVVFFYTQAVANPDAGADGDGVGNGDLTGDGPWVSELWPSLEDANVRDDLSTPQIYPEFEVDTSEDIFINADNFTARTGGMAFVDENGDGIVDLAQDSAAFADLQAGPFVDANRDTIHDAFQTQYFYQLAQMNNFVDVDADGICDNYEQDPWASENDANVRDDVSMPQLYPAFEVDINEDIFVNAELYTERTGGLSFEDNNGDGIVDLAQNGMTFTLLQIGAFADSNRDTIHDGFQTYEFYQLAQMNNFVDVDGDGLCDNYEMDPWAE